MTDIEIVCEECGNTISTVIQVERVNKFWEVSPGGMFILLEENSVDVIEYQCPICEASLPYEEAEKFL